MTRELEVAVGISREWDARKAGREVAEATIRKMHQPPNFFLLFSTIHYEKKGGFQEFLNGVWDVLPKETPLIGGTIAGFMTQEGTYSRGAVCVGFSGDIQIEETFARKTRKKPKTASRKVIAALKNKNNLVFAFLPGPSMPSIKKGEKLIVTKSKSMATIAPGALKLSTLYFNKGVGREMEVLECMAQALDSDIVGSSTIDDNNYNDNFQFYNTKFYSDALVVLGIEKIDVDIDTLGTMPIPEKWFKVTNTKTFGHILKEVEGNKALSLYLSQRGYNPEMIFEEPNLVHRRFVFAPVLTKDEYGGIHPRCPGTFYGNSLGFGHPIFDYVGFSLTDGKYINDQFLKFIDGYNQKGTNFLLMFSCAVLFEALGLGSYNIHKQIKEHFKNEFLIIFGGGEIVSEKSHNKGPKILEMSLTGVGFN